MSKKKDCAPKIRFTGFAGAWEQRKFDELVFRESVTCDKYGLPRVEYEDIISGQGQLNKDISEKESNKKGILFQAQDILFGKLRPYLQNWLLANFCGIAVGDFWVLRPNEMNPRFIYTLIQSTQFQRVSNLSIGTKMPRSDWNVVSKAEFAVPVDEIEQAKMGAFFDHLDNLITLYQREHDNTVNIKKSMLEKMFPKNGADKPEIRFAGFTDAWEHRKLGELGEFKNGMNFGKEAMGHGYPFVNLQNIFGRTVVDDSDLGFAESSENQRKEYSLRKGDVLFIRSSVKPEGVGEAALVPHTFENTTYSGFIIRFRPIQEMDNNFKQIIFSTANIRRQIMASATSSANTNINQESLQIIQVVFSCIKEQAKIGAFFATLDRLITLHQLELTKLQNMKKSLLEKMFI